jgi:hypothetical protein
MRGLDPLIRDEGPHMKSLRNSAFAAARLDCRLKARQ